MQVCHSLSRLLEPQYNESTFKSYVQHLEFLDVQWQKKEWEGEMQYQIFTRQIKRQSVKTLMSEQLRLRYLKQQYLKVSGN